METVRKKNMGGWSFWRGVGAWEETVFLEGPNSSTP